LGERNELGGGKPRRRGPIESATVDTLVHPKGARWRNRKETRSARKRQRKVM